MRPGLNDRLDKPSKHEMKLLNQEFIESKRSYNLAAASATYNHHAYTHTHTHKNTVHPVVNYNSNEGWCWTIQKGSLILDK